MNDATRGAIAGLAGTVAMSAAMAATRLAGVMRHEVPPRKITARSEDAVGLYDRLSQPEFEASWVVGHFAYGMANGMAYAAVRRRLPGPAPVAGSAFGLAVWAISYAGWLPAVGLYPPPTEDAGDRIAAMIAHHLVYGAATAIVYDSLARPRPEGIREGRPGRVGRDAGRAG